MIKEIKDGKDIRQSVQVIQKSFATVADEFGLTLENCPSNAAFIGESNLSEMLEKGILMFGLFDDNRQIGFVALEKSKSREGLYYLEKLAVLPDVRHKGMGRCLMDFSFGFVKKRKGDRISIGIINENTRLKEWYMQYGFEEITVKHFPHLPFTVCMLEKTV